MAYNLTDEELRRRVNPPAGESLPDLQQMTGAAPPFRSPPPPDPSADTFLERFHGVPMPKGERPYPIRPGTRERFQDPSKVITEAPNWADPRTLMQSYGSLSQADKSRVLGRERTAFDTIESVVRRSTRWPEGVQDPFAALQKMFPGAEIEGAFSRPGGMASIAQWMKAYERAVRAKGGSKSMASLALATRNLNNNLGGE